VTPSPGVSGGNYFASVLDELRKVVWPTWDELGRMTGVVVTTVVLMAIIVSAADFGIGRVVQQLYTSNTSSAAGGVTTGSTVSAQPSVAASPASHTSTQPPTSAPSSSGGTAPVSP
jgi:preprotein translocase subunit SecE